MRGHAFFFTLSLLLFSIFQPIFAQTVPEIAYETFRLDNGLTVLVHTDRKTPVVAVNLWYHVGSKDEAPGKTGFAHLFEHLMFQGSENYRDEFFKPFQQIGTTDQNGTTSQDRTNYYQTVPTTALDLALWMESDRMGHLLGVIDQARLDEQRGVVQNEKRQRENQPYGRVRESLLRASYPEGHPYRWNVIGSMEDLNAASLTDVHNWFKTYYGPNNAVLTLSGDIDLATAQQKVQRYFGDIPPGPPLAHQKKWVAERTDSRREIQQDRVAQTRIHITWNAPPFGSDDADFLDLAAQILGGSAASWLDARLVHREQIASSVSAFQISQELSGMFILQADVKPDIDATKVEQALNEELARLIKQGPTTAELNRAKTSIHALFLRGIETANDKAEVLAQCQVFMADPGCYRKQMLRTLSATPKQIQAAAQRWLGQGDFTLIVTPYPSLSTQASDVDRKKGIPTIQNFPEITFPKLERATLSNGAKLILAHRPNAPIVRVEFLFDAGFASDRSNELGTASFAMAMLDEGAGKLSSLDIQTRAETLGAQLAAQSSLDSSHAYVSAIKDKLDESVELLATVLLRPSFSDAEIERIRKQWLTQIEQEKTNPSALAQRLLPPLLYGDKHPYGIPFTGSGTKNSIQALSRNQLIQFHREWLRPDNATILVSGDVTLTEVKTLLEKHFNQWRSPSEPPITKQIANVERPKQTRIFLIDKPGAQQTVLAGGLLAPEMNYPNELSLKTANAALGGMFISRLNLNLREDKHWSYGVYSAIMNTKGQSPYSIMAPVQTDKTADALKEIYSELKSYVNEKPITSIELDTVKMSDVRSLPGDYETLASVIGAMQGIVIFKRPDDYVQTLKSRIESQTLEQVKTAGQTLIAPEQLTWVIIGDLKAIEKPIRELNLGEVKLMDTDGKILN